MTKVQNKFFTAAMKSIFSDKAIKEQSIPLVHLDGRTDTATSNSQALNLDPCQCATQ